MTEERPYVLSIAGMDPCGGAGIFADIKTFEMHQTMGMGVCSALTFQNEDTFEGLEWVPLKDILKQLDALISKYPFEYVKIGIIENLETLAGIIAYLKSFNPEIKIIWDPILKASAGYTFHQDIDQKKLAFLLSHCYLITPNMDEAKLLFNITEENTNTLIILAKNYQLNILLKGGHRKNTNHRITDELYTPDKLYTFEGRYFDGTGKHGTGCILSASITANLSKNKSLEVACLEAKKYIEQIITNNNGLLAQHYHENK